MRPTRLGDIILLHALLALGIWMLPWQVSVTALAMFIILLGIGYGVIVTAALGWLFFLTLCWRYA